jgi:N-acetylmuramoyl-L-alanine amidase
MLHRKYTMVKTAKKRLITGIILLIIADVLFFAPFSAAAPEDTYFDAEACYRSLRQNPQKIKYRHNWLRCIKKFQSVYRQDPAGAWAAAGLYKSAKMYLELAKFSGKGSDRKEALDIFQQIVADYPESRYRQKAAAEISNLGATVNDQKTPAQTAAAKSSVPGEETPKDAYIGAERCYSDLRKNPPKMKYRQNWLQCIDKFQSVYDKDPDGPWAPAGLFMAATLYQKLYDYSYAPDDLESADSIFNQIITRFPDSRYQAKAASAIQKMPESVKKQQTGESDPIAAKIEAREVRGQSIESSPGASSRPGPDGMATVTNLRFWSNPNYTRVVIDADREADYYHHLLKKDPSLNKPQRLYVDLSQSRLDEQIRKSVPIHDDLLLDARAGQYTSDSVRVVVDIKSFETYKIFSLKDPFRIVIDVWGTRAAVAPDVPRPSDTVNKDGKIPPGSLAKQLALGVRRIVIDPGHGGKDYGAPGYLKGVHEKHVVLQIARRLAKKIKAELGLEVIMTRSGDRFLTLEERTAFANTKNADLFISIHTNASRDRRAYGIETYFLNLATDEEAIRVAAMENATSTKNISDLQKILYDLMQNAKINESSRLAAYVQSSTTGHLKNKRYTRIKSKGVKQAPFYVLLGAQMPSILIETAFISNARECKRLVNPQFQERLAEGIVEGIRQYIKATSPTALYWTSPQSRPRG